MGSYLKFVSSLLLFGSNGVVAAHIALDSAEIVFLRTLIGAAFLGLVLLVRRARRGGTDKPVGAGPCPPFGRKAENPTEAAFSRSARRASKGSPLQPTSNPFVPRARSWLFVCASGAAMGLSWLFLYEAYREVGVAVASLAYYCAPILVMALSPLVFKERLTARSVASLAVVFAGAVLMNGATLGAGGSAWGMACGWASAVAHAAMVVCSKLGDDVDGLESSCMQLAVSFAVAAAFLAATGGLPFAVPAASWGWVAMLGVVNTGVGCYLYFSSFGGLSAQTVAVLGYLEPLSAVVCAAVFLGEAMTAPQLAGGVLIVGGAAFGTLATRPSSSRT